jgi:hypothetical protein
MINLEIQKLDDDLAAKRISQTQHARELENLTTIRVP